MVFLLGFCELSIIFKNENSPNSAYSAYGTDALQKRLPALRSYSFLAGDSACTAIPGILRATHLLIHLKFRAKRDCQNYSSQQMGRIPLF